MIEIEHLRAVGRAATEGPWEVAVDHHGRKGADVGIWSPSAMRYPVESLVPGNPNHATDAEFCATARNEWDALLDEVEELRAKVARVEALADELRRPDPELIVPIERAHRRTVGYELRAALAGESEVP